MPRKSRRESLHPTQGGSALGSLPVVRDLCRRLDVAGIIDRLCPIRDLAHASHGQVIEALIANRLTSPTPLVHVARWARDWAVPESNRRHSLQSSTPGRWRVILGGRSGNRNGPDTILLT